MMEREEEVMLLWDEDEKEEVLEDEAEEEERNPLKLARKGVAFIRKARVMWYMKMGDDFVFDFDDFETAQDVICFIKEKLSHPALISFLSSYLDDKNLHSTIPPSEDGTHPLVTYPLGLTKEYLNRVEVWLMAQTFPMQHVDYSLKTMDSLLSLVHTFGNLMGKIVPRDFGNQFTNSKRDALRVEWNLFVQFLILNMERFELWRTKNEGRIRTVHELIDTVRTVSPIVLKDYERVIFGIADDLQFEQYVMDQTQILLMKVFPALLGLKEPSDMVNHLLEVFPQMIEYARVIVQDFCSSNTMIVLLIGSLLSFKRPDSGTWRTVCEQLEMVVSQSEYTNRSLKSTDPDCTDNLRCEYFSYCLRDISTMLSLFGILPDRL